MMSLIHIGNIGSGIRSKHTNTRGGKYNRSKLKYPINNKEIVVEYRLKYISLISDMGYE